MTVDFSVEIQSALIGAGTTLFAALLGFSVVARQIKHEARLAMNQRAYEQLVDACGPATDATITFSGFIRQVQRELEAFAALDENQADHRLMQSRIPDLLQRQSHMADAQIAVGSMIERWLIVDPRIELFKFAFNARMHDTFNDLFPRYFDLVMDKLPADLHREGSNTVVFPPKQCTPEDLQEIRSLGEKMIADSTGFIGYIHDFQIEMQRLLLGELFKHNVPSREPIDPSVVVLTLRNHKALTKHFKEETAWGRYMMAVEEESRRKFEIVRSA